MQELTNDSLVGTTVIICGGTNVECLVGLRTVPVYTPIPKLYDCARLTVTKILQATLSTYDGVIAPVIRGVISLLVTGINAVVKTHLHHA